MNAPLAKEDTQYTWEDYLAWDDDVRYELIDGVAYAMSAPSQRHQRILGELHLQFRTYLKGKTCEVFLSPSDVRLDERNVLQPDLFVVCDKSKLDGQFTNGAPDLVIEILSPSSRQMDFILKYNKYLQAGVLEYWIVEPETNMVHVLLLENGHFIHNVYGENDKIASKIIEGCVIDMAEVFSNG